MFIRQSAPPGPHLLHGLGKALPMLVGQLPVWKDCLGSSFNSGVRVPEQAAMVHKIIGPPRPAFTGHSLSLRAVAHPRLLGEFEVRLPVSFCWHLPASPAESGQGPACPIAGGQGQSHSSSSALWFYGCKPRSEGIPEDPDR